ncbi:MAG: hypothetical protein ACI4II_01970 [Acutalibacteraceae bacterium]
MASENLVIDEERLNTMVKRIDECSTQLQNVLKQYLRIINSIKANAVKQGKAANQISIFLQCAGLLDNQLERSAKSSKDTCKAFLSEVRRIDNFKF